MKRTLLLTLFALVVNSMPAPAQGSGQYAGVNQCWNGKEFVTVKGNCPAANSTSGSGGASSGSSSAINSAAYGALNQASYQLGYAFGQWLFGGGKNPQAELQKRLMMEELARRQAEAARLHREEEARRLAAMYARLNATLKLSGLPDLQLKGVGNNGPGLQLKLGDSADGQAGIKGLPGIYLNDGKVPYGIPGLPGTYTGGPGQGSGLTNSKLALKTGDSGADTQTGSSLPAANPGGPSAAPDTASNSGTTNESKLALKLEDSGAAPASSAPSSAQAATFDPSKMTPQQLADAAEMFSKLPPEEQQRLMAAAQNAAGGQLPPNVVEPASTQALGPLQQQKAASQAAAAAPVLEDASAKARVGFDTGSGAPPPKLESTAVTPAMLRPSDAEATHTSSTTTSLARSEPPSPLAPDAGDPDLLSKFMFPATPSTSRFPRNPNPPPLNPLREEQKLQAQLKSWDDWALKRALEVGHPREDPLYPQATERRMLNTSAVKEYAPELLARYERDAAFRQTVDLRLQHTNEYAAFDYYKGLAEAHKAAVLQFQQELEKLAAAGKIDRLMALEAQYQFHPERRALVQAAWDRISANEQTALEKARAEGNRKVEREYQFTFQLIRGESSASR